MTTPTDQPLTKTAVAYIRVSTKEQATKGESSEGFSIPAQRDACERQAEKLGARLVEVFVDRGESARSAHRPELQTMLQHIGNKSTDYVIVHKVDRLARNRTDDVAINMAIQQAGATLVSCTENIDETPSGMLMHGILSSIAEFYSQNLATEVKKGALQKVKRGGTMGRAALGYLNVREVGADGREVRTIAIDPERSGHIVWAFETYAQGNHSIADLVLELENRGLTSKPHRRGGELKPVSKSQLGRILRDPYYTGKVKYKDVIYDGNHKPLISQDLFDDVQNLLTAKNISGSRKRIHDHPLKNTLTCKHCDKEMFLSMSKNRHGTVYPYFFCKSRRDDTCELPYVQAETIMAHVEAYYNTNIEFTDEKIDQLTGYLKEELAHIEQQDQHLIDNANKKLKEAEHQRKKLLNLYYAEDISRDLFKEEQERIDLQERTARQQLRKAATNLHDVIDTVKQALSVLKTWPGNHLKATDAQIRAFNNTFFSTTYVSASPDASPDPHQRLALVTEASQTLQDHNWQTGAPLIQELTPTAKPDKKRASPKIARTRTKRAGSNTSLLVREGGLEPPRPEGHRHLKPARLPIPPLARVDHRIVPQELDECAHNRPKSRANRIVRGNPTTGVRPPVPGL